MSATTARDLEAALLARCVAVAREVAPTAQDQREANVFEVAAMVIRSQFPRESMSLMLAANPYLAAHPNERLASGDVVMKGWVVGLPRLRDMLCRQLGGT